MATLTSSAVTYSSLAGLELQRKRTNALAVWGGGVPRVFCQATRWFQVPLPRFSHLLPLGAQILSHSHDIWNVAALQAFGTWA